MMMNRPQSKSSNHHAQKGSVLVYIMISIFLAGVLIMSLTDGPSRNARTQQLDETGMLLTADLGLIEATINDCVLVYPNPIDRDGDNDMDTTDNPNAPYPLIYDSTTGYATTGDIAKSVCPAVQPYPLVPTAAASTQQLLFSAQRGRSFRLLGDTATYTTTLTTDTTEGVYIKVVRTSASPIWNEAISRINSRYATCKVATDTAGGCANGCIYYWIRRKSSSVLGPETGCP